MYDASRDVTTAWHAVRLWLTVNNTKRLPSLVSELPKMDSQPASGRQNVAQLKATIGILSELYGIPLRKRARPVTRG